MLVTPRSQITRGRNPPVTITVSTTDKRDGKALALFARHDLWQRGKTKDGRSFFAIPSGSIPGLFQMTDCNDCSCKDRQSRAVVCYHMRAVRLWMAAFKTGAVSPKREAATSPADDLVVLTPEGAAYLADLAASPEAAFSSATQSDAVGGNHDCIVSDDTYATLARLRAEQKAHARNLRFIGYADGEEMENSQYAERAEQIARLEACMAHGKVTA